MSQIKNGGLDQYGAKPFEQQQFGTADVEGLKPWLHVKWCFISHVTTSETEIKLFQPLNLFQKYFGDTEHVGRYS